MHKGTKVVKINKLQQLTSRFESIRISEDESFDEFYAKLNDIVNFDLIWVKFMNNLKLLGKF